MPKVIKIKRGDVNSLNNHILADGELAFTRHRVMEGGVQRGETVDDHYFRVGDGTQAGGLVPGSDSIGVGLLFAITTAASATRQIQSLVGEYWTPWKMKTFETPYNPYRLTPVYKDCLTPDIYNSNIRVHLGTGFLMFDGTAFEMRLTENKFLYESDFVRSLDSVGGGNSSVFLARWTNLADWTGGDGYRRCSSILVESINDSSSTVSNQHMVGITATVANYSDATYCAAGSCFSAQPSNPVLDDSSTPTNKDFDEMVGYRVDSWDNIKWFDVTSTPHIGVFYGFKIDNQAARNFSRGVHGFHIDAIDTTNYCQGMYMESIGLSSLATDGIYIFRVGTNSARDSGATYAGGLTINDVGWYRTSNNSGSILARGIWLGDIRGKEESCGIRIGSVTATGPYNNGNPYVASMAIGVRIGNLKANNGTGWGCGFLVSPDTTTLDVGGAIGYSVNGLDVLSISSPGDVYAIDIYEVGITNAKKAHGFALNKLGNIEYTTDTYGVFLGTLKSKLNTAGVHITNLQCESSSASSAKGIYISNVSGSLNSTAYGIFAEGINANNAQAAGVFLGDVYASDTSNLSAMFGVYKQGQTSKYFKSFIVFGSGKIDYVGLPVASSITGLYFNSLGQSCYEAMGAYFDAIGCSDTGAGTSTVARGIYLKYIGNFATATDVQGILVGNGSMHAIKTKGATQGIQIGGITSIKPFNDGIDQSMDVIGLNIVHGRSFNCTVGVLVNKLAALGNSATYDSTAIGMCVGFLGAGSPGTSGGDVIAFYKKTQEACDKWQRFQRWENEDNAWPYTKNLVVFGAGGQDVYSGNASDATSSVYGIKFDGMGERYAHNVYGSYYHVLGSTSTNGGHCIKARGHVVNAVFAGVPFGNAVGFYVGELGAGPDTGDLNTDPVYTEWVSAFFKGEQTERNFHIMSVIGILNQDVVHDGDTSAAIYGLAFNALGDQYAKIACGVSLGNIGSGIGGTVNSNASEAYGIRFYGQIGHLGCITTRGIQIGKTSGRDVVAIQIDDVISDAGYNGTLAHGVSLNFVTGVTDARGLHIAKVSSVSNFGSYVMGLSVGEVSSIGNDAVGYGIRIGSVDVPNGISATGIELPNITSGGQSAGINILSIACTAGTSAKGLSIGSITGYSSARGIDFGNISTIDLGTSSEGIYLTSVTSTNASKGIYIGNVSTSATSSTSYGLYLGSVHSNADASESRGIHINAVHADSGLVRGIDLFEITGETEVKGINIITVTSIGTDSSCYGLNITTVNANGPTSTGYGILINEVKAPYDVSGITYGIAVNSVHGGGIARGLYIGTVTSPANGSAIGIDVGTIRSGSDSAYGMRIASVVSSGTSGIKEVVGYSVGGVPSSPGGTGGVSGDNGVSGAMDAYGFYATGINSHDGTSIGAYIFSVYSTGGSGTGNICGIHVDTVSTHQGRQGSGHAFGIELSNISTYTGIAEGGHITAITSSNSQARGLYIGPVTGNTLSVGIGMYGIYSNGTAGELSGLSILYVKRQVSDGNAAGITVDDIRAGSSTGNAYGIYIGGTITAYGSSLNYNWQLYLAAMGSGTPCHVCFGGGLPPVPTGISGQLYETYVSLIGGISDLVGKKVVCVQ